MPLPRTDPEPGARATCAACGEPVGVLWHPTGAIETIDQPRFDADLGWVCPPHVCGLSLERVRAELESDAAAADRLDRRIAGLGEEDRP